MVFASTLFSRAVDPVIPKIAHDLGIDVSTAALLSTAFTFPYAFAQPALGTIGDFFGKTRLMNLSLAMVVMTTLVCAFAQSFSLLVAMRVIAGILAGGIYPVGVAMVGDLVPDVHKRQVAIGQLLAVALTGNLIGATVSGVIGDLLGWRGVFFSIGAFGLVVAVIAFFAFRGLPTAKPKPINLAAVAAGFRSVFADPRAKICFGSVFFEGIVIHGMFPYVALLLLMAGQTHSSFAGLVIAGFGLGGILYSLAVPFVILRVQRSAIDGRSARVCAAAAFLLIALNPVWYVLAGDLCRVRHRILHAAHLHSAPCHRTDADRARHRSVDAFLRVLFRPGARPDLLRLCLQPRRHQQADVRRGRGDPDSRAGLCAVSEASAARIAPCRRPLKPPLFPHRPGVPRKVRG